MEKPKTITDIPTELLERVATLVDPNDLFALRRTCRAISRRVDDAFVATFFTVRKHCITDSSLQGLVQICGHERLRRRLRSIRFVYVRDAFDSYGLRTLFAEDTAAIDAIWDTGVLQSRFDKLTLALTDLKSAGITLSISVDINDSPYGLMLEPEFASEEEDPVEMLLQSMAYTSFPVTELALSIDEAHSHARLRPHYYTKGAIPETPRVFHQLRVLGLIVCSGHHYGDHKQVTDLLKSAPSIERLLLDFRGESRLGGDVLFWRALAGCKLKSLAMMNYRCSREDLMRTLSSQKLTLESVHFRYVDVWDSEFDAWNAVLEHMANTLTLNHCELEYLAQSSELMDGTKLHSFEGSQEVKDGLKRLAETATFSWAYLSGTPHSNNNSDDDDDDDDDGDSFDLPSYSERGYDDDASSDDYSCGDSDDYRDAVALYDDLRKVAFSG